MFTLPPQLGRGGGPTGLRRGRDQLINAKLRPSREERTREPYRLGDIGRHRAPAGLNDTGEAEPRLYYRLAMTGRGFRRVQMVPRPLPRIRGPYTSNAQRNGLRGGESSPNMAQE